MARMVLIADDSPTIQKKALGILKGAGFEVETVSNGVAAIKRLAVIHPTVILADVSMPGRDGYEVCEFVKKSAELSRVPVLLVASDMEPYDDARGAQVRADGIIKKPFEAQELINVVVKFAEQFEAEMAAAAAPDIAPPAAHEPTHEFAFSREEPEDTPTVVQHVAPDFSAASEGVAFAEPAVEEGPGYYTEPLPVEAEGVAFAEPAVEEAPGHYTEPLPVEAEGVAFAEPAVEEGPGHYAEPLPVEAEGVAFAEPAVEEGPGHYAEPLPVEMEVPYSEQQLESGIALDRDHAPEYLEAPPGPAPEPQSVPVEEPLSTMEEPAAASSFASPPPSPARAPSYLDGLEASTPEPVFIEEQAPQPPEAPSPHAEMRTMIFRAPLEISEPVWRDETVPAPPEPEPSAPSALEPSLEAEPPAASTEIPAELPPEPPYITPSVAATSLDSFSLDDATAGQVHFASHAAEVAPVEVTPVEDAPMEVAPVEVAPAEVAPEEVAPMEVARAQIAPMEAAHFEPAPEAPAAEIAPTEPAPETPSTEVAFPKEAFIEEAGTDVGPLEAPPEAPREAEPETAPEAPPEAAFPEPPAETAAPLSDHDWGLIYSVVHRVVVRMSPPVLPMEAVEEMARRLADEIATEIVTESSQPPA